MGSKLQRTNWKVIVEPRHPGNYGYFFIGSYTQSEDRWRADCEEIKNQIKRHVDGVQDVYIEWDTEVTCEHCGAEWTEGKDSPHNGGCCHTDCEVFEKESD